MPLVVYRDTSVYIGNSVPPMGDDIDYQDRFSEVSTLHEGYKQTPVTSHSLKH